MQSILVDAGPLIAVFSPGDRHRPRCEAALSAFSRNGVRLVTTWPCIVETAYMLGGQRKIEFLTWMSMGGTIVYPFDPSHVKDMVGWMDRYSETGKTEMDFADASLYWVAVDTGITDILTTDLRDFERYRLPDGSSFTVL